VLTTKELLARLREKKVKNADIARALGVTPSRVTEMFDGTRALKLDEAAKLSEAFDLEPPPSPQVPALPAPVSQLIVQHIARELGRPLAQDAPQLLELTEDLRAFSEFVTDPKVRESIDLAMAFFQAMRLRRPAPATVS
jgi:transcriptional regulator with XRE-family HTH domain